MEGDHKLDVKAQGRECRYKPTSRQELDARDTAKNAEMTAVKSANSVPLDFDAKLQKLVKGLVRQPAQMSGNNNISDPQLVLVY